MKLNFVIDPGYDFKMCVAMLHSEDWEFRSKYMEIDQNLAQKIHKSQDQLSEELKKELVKVIEDEYAKVLPYMEETKNLYQKSWNEIIDEFSKTVEELTYPWVYDEYTCVVTHFNPGISNWNGNIIGRWWKENPYTQRRITAHEILIAHYFSIHKKYFPNKGFRDEQIWVLAEIASFALAGLEERLKKFWQWDKTGYYTNHNYPQIVELQNKLKETFINRKSFEEYVKKGIMLIKNN